MSHTNEVPQIDQADAAACSSGGCPSCCKGVMRAAVYMPVALILGGLAAVAMFPDLADYGYPLIGKPSQIGFSGERPCSAGGSCSAGTKHSGYPLQSDCTATLIDSPGGSCCPLSGACPSSAESTSETGLSDSVTKSEPLQELPADAISALNVPETETSAN